MSTQGEIEARRLGRIDGIRAAVTWLHERAKVMNDPHAAAILNSAAFHLGVDKPERVEPHDPSLIDLEPPHAST